MARVRFKVGEKVTTAATVRPRQFANKTGTVFRSNRIDGEIGVWFGNWLPDGHEQISWFLPSELDTASSRPVARTAIRRPAKVQRDRLAVSA